MKVIIGNKKVDLSQFDVIGSGGEGLVVKARLEGQGEEALKVYHNPTRERSNKLSAFFSQRWDLPTNKIALPQQPIYNLSKDLIVGITMPYLGSGFEDVALFSNRKKRVTYGITNKLIADVFLDGHESLDKIHDQGLVVGDFNDLNVLFRNRQMLWIDVDAWQFGKFACPVATLDFLDPELYGIDLSKRPVFKENNDWYSFAVMLFRSLLLTHPYGGVHSRYKTLQMRTVNKITVLDKDVKFPKIALSPDILSDDLASIFLDIFSKGERKPFPKKILQEYSESLTECSSCHTFYPMNRKGCPVCNKRTLVIISKPVVENKDIRVTRMFTTQGNIVYTKVQKNTIYVISHNNKKAILHKIDRLGRVKNTPLGSVNTAVRYAIGGDLLAVNPIHTEDLLLIDISESKPKILSKTVTEIYSPSRKAAFQATGNSMLRIAKGNILSIEKGGINIVEKYIRDGIANQTWFSANGLSDKLQLFGLIQILKDQRYWYYINGKHLEPEIPNLKINEGLIDISVKFSGDTVLLRRETQIGRTKFLRMEIVDEKGKITHSTKIKLDDYPIKSIHGQTYSNGVLIHATDNGLMQENVVESKFKTFSQTENYVKEGDSIYKYQNGILVSGVNTLTFLELTK